MTGKETKGVFHAWLSLVRPPNLVTVPGDPLAGFFVASFSGYGGDFSGLAFCCVASLCIYMGGLILNDAADHEEDARERPHRPIPSGLVSLRQALAVGFVLMGAGWGLAAMAGFQSASVAFGLIYLVLMYNFISRRFPWIGVVNMGLCRGASVLLGASVAGCEAVLAWRVLLAAGGVAAYIAYVSIIARRETEDGAAPVRVGRLIRRLLILQALLCAAGGMHGIIAGVCLLMLWPVGAVLSKRFYAS